MASENSPFLRPAYSYLWADNYGGWTSLIGNGMFTAVYVHAIYGH